MEATAEVRDEDVPTVHIASWQVAEATEVAIRSVHWQATSPFRLRVGHSGTDYRSERMLRSLESSGWLALDIVEGIRHHGLWLDHWLATCPTRYALFVDSDVEFRKRGALSDLVAALRASGAAMQTGAMELAMVNENDVTGQTLGRAPRPAPYVLAVDVAQARKVEASFYQEMVPGNPPVLYDTGARFNEAAVAVGLRCEAMPDQYHRTIRHYRNVSWAGNLPWYRPVAVRHRLLLPYIRARRTLLRAVQRRPSPLARPSVGNAPRPSDAG